MRSKADETLVIVETLISQTVFRFYKSFHKLFFDLTNHFTNCFPILQIISQAVFRFDKSFHRLFSDFTNRLASNLFFSDMTNRIKPVACRWRHSAVCVILRTFSK